MLGFLLEILKIISVLALSFASIMFFIGGVKVMFADKTVYKRNNRATAGFWNALKGTVPTKRDGVRTHTVAAGLAYDLKKKRIVAQGTLSNEAVESILR
jgi:hypothetical protein